MTLLGLMGSYRDKRLKECIFAGCGILVGDKSPHPAQFCPAMYALGPRTEFRGQHPEMQGTCVGKRSPG